MRLYITEKLALLDEDPVKNIEWIKDQEVQTVLAFAFKPEHKFKLPEGVPATRSVNTNRLGNSVIEIRGLYSRFINFIDETKIPKENKRWLKFIEYFEGLSPEEQGLLVAIKDQKLTDLYKNITVELLANNGLVI